MTTRKNKRRAGSSVGDRILAGLNDLRETLRAGVPLNERFTVRTVEIVEPEAFSAVRVQALRRRLGVSQGVFAKLTGVSRILVQSWEQGTRKPSPLACRLLLEMERDPFRWQAMIVMLPPARRRQTRQSA